MNDGRLIFTAEKRAPGFYQLALRRMNLDGGDYHPLYAQRAIDRLPRGDAGRRARGQELRDDLLEPRRAAPGRRARRLQPLARHRLLRAPTPTDYPIDPTVIDPTSATLAGAELLPALALVRRRHRQAAHGKRRAGRDDQPDVVLARRRVPIAVAAPEREVPRELLASGRPDEFRRVDVLAVRPRPARADEGAIATGGDVDAVAVYGRFNHGTFRSAVDEPNGNTQVDSSQPDAHILVLDMAVLGVAHLPEHADGARARDARQERTRREAEFVRRLRGSAADERRHRHQLRAARSSRPTRSARSTCGAASSAP